MQHLSKDFLDDAICRNTSEWISLFISIILPCVRLNNIHIRFINDDITRIQTVKIDSG